MYKGALIFAGGVTAGFVVGWLNGFSIGAALKQIADKNDRSVPADLGHKTGDGLMDVAEGIQTGVDES